MALESSPRSARILQSFSSFSSSPAWKNSCSTAVFAASSSVAPTFTCTKSSLRYFAAIFFTALGQVAVKSKVCLVAGVSARILAISGSKPMSSILSASSRTRKETPPRDTAPISIRSWSRPGVATRRSAPFLAAFTCGGLGAPPKTAREVTLAHLPNLRLSASICVTSSRVGARTRAAGIELPSVRDAMTEKAGSKYPSVLPLPVLATATRSAPLVATGQDWA
mmetsp:Transcript_27753/g.60684  ORF Transcript_27753/g.60684 Transcript_27753/m.60684 type:complete len:223 (+) Transcript_27753:539-1207(+)